ncbi:type VI secretion system protein TssA [Marinobacter panjinensis]|uniref:Type VI secretion system protein TssA n=1 Tax=Marinobacter panjinensis TaxID=2576384 RepID=A0A4U6R8K8_9GAMM|nr:type VI secretion system protein TssA [Marinobacter panjinensis]MCR8914494.1 type VI secretion system protein TssA [Marinobacter panjinensis]TKV68676.1 type VI secretion system protein TssA [Marinobacter panjinensis]
MQAVEQHPYVEQVLSAFPGESATGENLMDDATMEYLENEIMKVGSLAHTGVEWGEVESESLRLLSDTSKDLKVLGFLMLCLQRGGNGERFALSLYLLHRVLDSWWDDAWPYPGDKGKRARKMLLTQILQRALKEVSAMSFDGGVGDGREFCLTILGKLMEQAGARELPDDGLVDLRRAVEKLPSPYDTPIPPEAADKAQTAASSTSGMASSHAGGASSTSLGNLTLDPANERATRQSLLKVADMLTETTPADELGYQLRRYAIWQTITSVPPARDGVKSDLAAVSADRVADYRESLSKSPDLALWQRIEQSLSVSPFWLEGHWLSAQVASALGHEACAEAIRTAVKAFVERLPELADMTFNDGTPFLPRAVADWILSGPAKGGSAGGASSWEQAYDDARGVMEQKGLAAAMQLLEEGLEAAREPRDRFYWRLMSSQLMKDSGMKSLAKQQVQDLREQTRGMSLEDWEPGLVARLDRLA